MALTKIQGAAVYKINIRVKGNYILPPGASGRQYMIMIISVITFYRTTLHKVL